MSPRRHDALRRRAGLEQARHLQHGGRRGRHRARRRSRSQVVLVGRRADRPRARRRDGIAYVLTRFDNSISVVDLDAKHGESARRDVQPRAGERDQRPRVPLRREPAPRSTATTACASCHIGGDFDELAWDLGNPGASRCRSRTHRARPSCDDPTPTSSPAGAARAALPAFAPTFSTTAAQGPDDDAEPARHGQPRPDALARRPQRRHQQNGAPFIDPATTRRSSRRSRTAGIFDEFDALQRRSTSPSRASSATPRSSRDDDMTDFTNFILQVTLSAEPDPQPRQLAHGGAAGRARFFFNQRRADGRGRAAVGPLPQLQRLPRARPERQRAAPRRTPASSAPTARCRSSSRPSSSRSRTCATCTRRSACSARRPIRCSRARCSSPEQTRRRRRDQVRGFGFLHDGSLGQLEHFFTGQVFLQTTTTS